MNLLRYGCICLGINSYTNVSLGSMLFFKEINNLIKEGIIKLMKSDSDVFL